MRRSRGKGGFVLFEVLVATAILSAGCVVVIQALATALKASRTLQGRYSAALALEDAVWTMDHSGGNFDAQQARTPEGFQNAEWTTQQPADLSGGMRRTAVTIRWTSLESVRDNHQEDLTLATYGNPDEPTASN